MLQSIHKPNNRKIIGKDYQQTERVYIPDRSCSNDLVIFLQDKGIKAAEVDPR